MKSLPKMITAFVLVAASCQISLADAEAEKAFRAYGEFMVGGVWTRDNMEHTYKWVLNKKFVQIATSNGKTLSLTGIDPETA